MTRPIPVRSRQDPAAGSAVSAAAVGRRAYGAFRSGHGPALNQKATHDPPNGMDDVGQEPHLGTIAHHRRHVRMSRGRRSAA